MNKEPRPEGKDGTLQVYDPASFGSSARWLLQQLRAEGVEVHGDSALARSLRAIEEFGPRLSAKESFSFCTPRDAYEYLAEVFGMDFVSRCIHHGYESGLRPPVEMWRNVASSDLNLFRPGESDKKRNTGWELVIASIIANFASNVVFTEPDITCTWRDLRVNIAAKVAYSSKKLWTNAKRGYQQAAATPADLDLVLVNTAQLIPSIEVFRHSYGGRFGEPTAAVAWVKQWAKTWCDNREMKRLYEKLEAEAQRPITIALFMPLILEIAGSPLPFFYTHTPLTTNGADYEFAAEFLQVSSSILRDPLVE